MVFFLNSCSLEQCNTGGFFFILCLIVSLCCMHDPTVLFSASLRQLCRLPRVTMCMDLLFALLFFGGIEWPLPWHYFLSLWTLLNESNGRLLYRWMWYFWAQTAAIACCPSREKDKMQGILQVLEKGGWIRLCRPTFRKRQPAFVGSSL